MEIKMECEKDFCCKVVGISNFGRNAVEYVSQNIFKSFKRKPDCGDASKIEYVFIDDDSPETASEFLLDRHLECVLSGADIVFAVSETCDSIGTLRQTVEASKALGNLTVALVTDNSREYIDLLSTLADSVIVIPKSDCAERVNQAITDTVEAAVVEMFYFGVVGIDFQDISAVFKNTKKGFELTLEGKNPDEVKAALDRCERKEDLDRAKWVLVDVLTSPETSLDEINHIVGSVSERLLPESTILFSVEIEASCENKYLVRIIATDI